MRFRDRHHLIGASSALLAATGLLGGIAGPASAQEDDEAIGNVVISFDVGDYDTAIDDWVVEVVEVAGDLDEGEDFAVEILGADDEVLFTATQPYSGTPTRIDVSTVVAVGDVESAGISQAQDVVGGVVVERPEVDWSASGGGGSGQLALSMVMAVVIVAIIFRTPMPSSSTQRWTK